MGSGKTVKNVVKWSDPGHWVREGFKKTKNTLKPKPPPIPEIPEIEIPEVPVAEAPPAPATVTNVNDMAGVDQRARRHARRSVNGRRGTFIVPTGGGSRGLPKKVGGA